MFRSLIFSWRSASRGQYVQSPVYRREGIEVCVRKRLPRGDVMGLAHGQQEKVKEAAEKVEGIAKYRKEKADKNEN